jgi:hypothetical protein
MKTWAVEVSDQLTAREAPSEYRNLQKRRLDLKKPVLMSDFGPEDGRSTFFRNASMHIEYCTLSDAEMSGLYRHDLHRRGTQEPKRCGALGWCSPEQPVPLREDGPHEAVWGPEQSVPWGEAGPLGAVCGPGLLWPSTVCPFGRRWASWSGVGPSAAVALNSLSLRE